MHKYHAPVFGVKTNYKKPVFFFDSSYIDGDVDKLPSMVKNLILFNILSIF